MGLSGGGGTKSSSSSISGSAQKWAQPFAKAGATDVTSVFNQAQPGLQGLTNLTQNDLVPSLISQFHGGMGAAQQGTNWASDVLGGKYLNGNPYLEQMIGASNRDITNGVASTYASAGRYGSAAHDGALGQAIADNENQYRFQNYATEADRMGQAAQYASGSNLANEAAAMQAISQGAELPYTGSNSLANALGALFNGGTSTSTSKTSGPGLFQSLLAAGAQVGSAAIAACDIRLKENIRLYNVEADGLPIYSFTYKPGLGLPEGEQINPMAQDVAVFRPWALGPEQDGFMTIYPAKL